MIARTLGISRNTVRAALAAEGPPRYVRAGSAVDAFEPRIREQLRAVPTMPATVIAERVGWTRGMTVFKERVAELRPAYLPPDPASRTTYEAGELAQFDFWFPDIELPVSHDDVRLVVSELANNAIRHANTPFAVTLEQIDQSVLLRVADGSPIPPVRLATNVLDTSGRGMSIVDLVSRDWGVTQRPGEAKLVWASFALQVDRWHQQDRHAEARGVRAATDCRPGDQTDQRAGQRRAEETRLAQATKRKDELGEGPGQGLRSEAS